MIVQTPAIVLKSFPYGDTSLVARCFTREMGKISIIARGARRNKSPMGAYLQPMSFIELVFYHKTTRELQTASRMSFLASFSGIMSDLKKIALGLATVELTDRTLRDQDTHTNLFDELVSVLKVLNERQDKLNLVFWYYQLKLLTELGFRPDLYDRELPGYRLPDPAGGPNSRQILEALLNCDLESLPTRSATAADRKVISEYINAQIRYHFEDISELQSFKVLKQILD